MPFHELTPWIYSIGFAVLALWIIGSNIWYLLQARRAQGTTSLTLFVGGILGALALLTAPPVFLKWLAWLPLVVDPGTGYAAWKIFRTKSV